ncbi:MAG TPA: MlaD family protein [Chthoniobacter sp.]|jgi:ABC-type transporter Mla subunit MlaD
MERKGLEFFVGLFLLVGFGVVATLVVLFGRVGGVEKLYPIRVRFPNASGLIKGSDVLLSGAAIGTVTAAPKLTGDNYEVEVELSIRDAVRIPRKSAFQIRSNGMLGDAYVDVVVPAKFEPNDFAQPGELVNGQRTGGFDELMTKGTQTIDTLNTEILRKVSAELDELKATTVNINDQLLSKTNLKNLEDSLANLKTTTEQFSKAARDLDLFVNRTEETMDTAKGAMKTIDGAAGELKLAVGDYRKVADSARILLGKASNGDGTLGMLISDHQTADNLKALIANLKRSGVVFYKDRPMQPTDGPGATPLPARRR